MKNVVIALLMILPNLAMACSCRGYEIEEAFKDYEFVFRGVVKSIGSKWVWEKGYWLPNSLDKVKFEVTKNYKSSASEKVTAFTHPQSSACGFTFKEGIEYVVFAYPGSKKSAEYGMAVEGGAMITSCSPTIHYEAREEYYEEERLRVIKYLESRAGS
ncbi:hypothetical protein ACJJI5_11075 [Microbulbifer sp. EKSA008]|uniref:hypothetical protein n=1 Tax=Microbulbifer sp. EKSA008 TaxID=3243367 RepID=UPI00404254E4